MADKQIKMKCKNCNHVTKLVVDVPNGLGGRKKKSKEIEIVKYCGNCKEPNILRVPETWDSASLILGDAKKVLRYDEGVPVIQGE